MVDATPVNVTVERQLYRVGMADSMGGGVGLARQHASFRIQSQRARLIVTVTVTAIGVGQRAFPAFIQHLINLQGDAVLIAPRGVITFVEAAVARRIYRFAGARINDGAAVERHQIFHMFVGNAYRGALAIPHQRRRNHRLAVTAKVTPVIGFIVIDNHPVGEPGGTKRTGDVQLTAAALEAAAPAFHMGALLQLRLFGDHVDHPARFPHAVKHRSRAFQHLNPLSGRGKITRLHRTHAVTQNGAVAVITKTALHHRVLGTAQGVRLGNATDVIQRFIQAADRLIGNHLLRHHVDCLRHIQQAGLGSGAGHTGQRLITLHALRRGLADHHQRFPWFFFGGFVGADRRCRRTGRQRQCAPPAALGIIHFVTDSNRSLKKVTAKIVDRVA
ncbi:hypothetical protein D3C72_1076270 [compost metagenome]